MDGFEVLMVMANILFARLGMRLITAYIKMKKELKVSTNDKILPSNT